MEPKLGHRDKKQSVSIPRICDLVGRRLGSRGLRREHNPVKQKVLDAMGESEEHCSLHREMGEGGGSGASNKHFLYIFKGGAGVSQKSEIRKLMEQKAF